LSGPPSCDVCGKEMKPLLHNEWFCEDEAIHEWNKDRITEPMFQLDLDFGEAGGFVLVEEDDD